MRVDPNPNPSQDPSPSPSPNPSPNQSGRSLLDARRGRLPGDRGDCREIGSTSRALKCGPAISPAELAISPAELAISPAGCGRSPAGCGRSPAGCGRSSASLRTAPPGGDEQLAAPPSGRGDKQLASRQRSGRGDNQLASTGLSIRRSDGGELLLTPVVTGEARSISRPPG